MEANYTIISRVSLKNGVLQEEILHRPIPKEPLPWWQQALRALLCLWLLLLSGFFDDMGIEARLIELIIWCNPLLASFIILYAILNDCQTSGLRK